MPADQDREADDVARAKLDAMERNPAMAEAMARAAEAGPLNLTAETPAGKPAFVNTAHWQLGRELAGATKPRIAPGDPPPAPASDPPAAAPAAEPAAPPAEPEVIGAEGLVMPEVTPEQMAAADRAAARQWKAQAHADLAMRAARGVRSDPPQPRLALWNLIGVIAVAAGIGVALWLANRADVPRAPGPAPTATTTPAATAIEPSPPEPAAPPAAPPSAGEPTPTVAASAAAPIAPRPFVPPPRSATSSKPVASAKPFRPFGEFDPGEFQPRK